MLNRQVRQILPQVDREGQMKAFGDYSEFPNIVLLGDPGAGKTHLFKQFAAKEGATYLKVRQFIGGIPLEEPKTLFIDALDEKRSGNGRDDTVDDIVRRLFSHRPHKVRISCRSQDWLGESDLSVFLPYFEQTGGYVVLHLQQLLREEQLAILQAHGIEQPSKFLEEAKKRSAYEFLHNPQNLLMLVESVKEGNWPRTRSELFYSATQFLLTEHSREHTQRDSGIYTSDELEEPAGTLCALRILSDVSGISLLPNDNRSEYPSYRTIPFFSNKKIRAALSRRVFSAGDELETVDYSHRTIAEYLAAKWLASRVEQGLPVGRLRSLLGFEGYPSSELRGLHAWLAVFLPQYSNVFIEADPYGVLSYGDAASLSTLDKQNLLVELSKLSESDPWFRTHGLSSYLNGFMSGELKALLRKILNDPQSRFSMRMLVLESLSVTTPIPELSEDLINVIKFERFSYAEKEEATTALIHLGLSGKAAVVNIFSELKDKNHDNIRLRNHIIQLLYNENFSSHDVAQLLIDTLNVTREELPIGALWGLIDIVPVDDLFTIFEFLYQHHRENREEWNSLLKHSNEAVYFIEIGLSHILNECNLYSAAQIWVCLSVHYSFTEHYHSHPNKLESIIEQLKQRNWQYEGIIDAAIFSYTYNDKGYLFLHEFKQSTFGIIPDEFLLARFVHHLSCNELVAAKAAFIYRLAFEVLYSCEVPSLVTFELLASYRYKNKEMNNIYDSAVVCEIADWRVKYNIRRIAHQKDIETRLSDDKCGFDLYRQQIISGLDLGWLKYIAYIYYAKFSDANKNSTPLQRLSNTLGSENVADAISGLLAVLNRSDLPTIDEINNSFLQGKYYEWWYAILAGSDELFKLKPDIMQWSEELLSSLLALDIELSIYVTENNITKGYSLSWKKSVILHKTSFFIETYRYIINFYFTNKFDHIRSLNYLLNDTSLPNDYIIPLVIDLAKEYPDDKNHLKNLVGWLLNNPQSHAELLQLSKTIVGQLSIFKSLTSQIWLVCCYLLTPEFCQDLFISEAQENPEMIKLVCELSGNAKRYRGDNQEQKLSLIQLETICTIAAKHFPNTYYSVNRSNDSNDNWHYSEFIRGLINSISSISSFDAGLALKRLLSLKECGSYQDHLLHAQSNQWARYRESQFDHSDWKQIVSTLKNQTPANVMDLYSLLLDVLRDISNRIAYENTDIYKQFWNEDGHGKILVPKPEESCRNFFLELLRTRLYPLKISSEPEGHMVSGKRADIIISLPGIKIPIEIKRDYHRDVWTALNVQLDGLYAKNPDASGYGIYLVFWFGSARPNAIPRLAKNAPQPENVQMMENMLNEIVPAEKRERLSAIVLDVSGK